MKRWTLTILASAALVGCDPSGSTIHTNLSAKVRLAHLVTDVAALDLVTDGTPVVANQGFFQISTYRTVSLDDSILAVLRHSDAAELATDTVHLVNGRRYSLYAVGNAASTKARFVLDDTLFAIAGQIKLRIINGVGTHAGTGLDFYASLPGDSLTALTPQVPALAFGSASPYIPTDTSFRRLRLTLDGVTTAIFDTTLATPIPDSSVVTIVVSDKQGGGSPFRLMLQVDKAP